MKAMKVLFAILIVLTFSSDLLSQNIWQRTNGPYTGSYIEQLTVNPAGHIFACSYSAGIFRSVDYGNTWVEINQGLPLLNFEGDRVMCVSSNGDLYSSADNLGIFKSTNNGNSWFQTGLTHTIFDQLVVKNNGYVFAGTRTGGGIYRSTNGGVSWTHLENGLPTYLAVYSLSIAPEGTIYASSGMPDTSLYFSTNNGESWQPTSLTQMVVQASVVNQYNDVFVSGGYNGNFFVYSSTNGGMTWELKANGLACSRFYSMYCDPNNILFACSDSGLYRSTNNGNNWFRIGFDKTVYSFVKKQTGEYFLSVARKGVYKSTNSGASWLEMNNGLSVTYCGPLSISNNGNIYVGSIATGAFRSTNNGTSWIRIWDGGSDINLYPVFQGPNGYIYAADDLGLCRSTNNGANWSRVNSYMFINTFFVNSSDHIFLGCRSPFSGIYRSTNNGSNWSMVWYGTAVNTIISNPSGHLFAGTAGGVYRSTDNGNNWARIGNLNEEVFSMVSAPNGFMFAGTRNHGLFRSTNSGINWINIWPQFEAIFSLAANQIGNLFAAVPYIGIYRSTNYGVNWTEFSSGLFNRLATSLAVNPGGYLFAGTYGAGVYKTVYSTIGIEKISGQVPGEFLLSQNYPNPFNSSTRIEFALPKTSFVKIRIFDINGKEISTLVYEELNAGIYGVDWDAANYSSGVYFYRLEAGEFVESKRMVLIK